MRKLLQLALLIALLVPPGAAWAHSFVRLESPNVPSQQDLSPDGSWILGPSEIYNWRTDQLIPLVGVETLSAHGLSAGAGVVVGHDPAGAYRWVNGVRTNIGLSSAWAISADGTTVVGGAIGGGSAFWRSGSVTPLGPWDAYDVSADGGVFVGEALPRPVLWAGGQLNDLGDLHDGDPNPAGFFSFATFVSGDGSTAVGYSIAFYDDGSEIIETFLSQDGNLSGLGHLLTDVPANGQLWSWPTSISGNGSQVVGFSHCSRGRCSYLWDPANGMREAAQAFEEDYGFDFTNWELTVQHVSDDGAVFTGTAIDPLGQSLSFAIELPEPSALGLLSLAALTTALRRRRGRRSRRRRGRERLSTPRRCADPPLGKPSSGGSGCARSA
jgi:hypothetical protein